MPHAGSAADGSGSVLAKTAQPTVRSVCLGESRDAANFTGLVLGCIETKFCK